MDPFYGYDNSYSGSAGGGAGGAGDQNPNDPSHYNSWSNQWTAPAAAAAAQQQGAGGFQFPQYVSPQQQQAQQQAQQTYAAMNPNSMGSFMQKSQQQQFQQNKFGQHGPIGAPKQPQAHHQLSGANATNPRSFGAFGGVSGGTGGGGLGAGGVGRGAGGPGGLAQEWVAPQSAQQMQFGMAPNLRTFPSKAGGGGGMGGGGMMNRPNWKQQKAQRQANAAPKKIETAGKTPAMILHEVFKHVSEDFSEVADSNPKRYCCTLTVEGRKFQMESPNKKTAKQKCAELAVRTLRPELNVTPFAEGAAPKAVAPKPATQKGPSTPTKRNADDAIAATPPPTKKKDNGSSKKAKEPKLAPVELAASLNDLMMRLILERGTDNKITPVYEAVELPPVAVPEEAQPQVEEPIIKQEEPQPEEVKEEPVDADDEEKKTEEETSGKKKWRKDKDRVRRPDIQVQYSLKFAEIGKEYTKTGTNRGMLKDMVIREALRDLFNVSQEDIGRVARRFAMNRLTKDMNLAQCLYSTCSIFNCSVQLLSEPAEDRPLGDGRAYFMGKCILTDHNKDGQVFETKTDSLSSKVLAKDHAAQEMLKQYFDIDPNTISQDDGGNNNNNAQGPASLLHAMLNKKTKQRTAINYEFKDNVPPVAGAKQNEPVFYCDCVIDEERFTGQGRSKKLAKNAAAVVALKKKFDIDFDPTKAYPLAHDLRPEQLVSKMCAEVAEVCKKQYYARIEKAQITPSNCIAAFVLINEENQKRVCAWASSSHTFVVEPDNLNGANGNHLIHFDPIVLARRSFCQSLCNEVRTWKANDKNFCLEPKEDGRYGLKPNLKLVIFSNYAPGVVYSADDAPVKSLAMVKQIGGLAPVPSETLDVHEIRKSKELRVHCAADKIYKWSQLGVQGGLLSNIIQPIHFSHIFFGTQYQVTDDSLKFALSNRLASDCAPGDRADVTVESIPQPLYARIAPPQVWGRGIPDEEVEVLCCNTGRTQNGMPSRVCKAAIFDEYLAIPHVHAEGGEVNYAKEKERAANYQYEKRVFYNKLEAAGLGKWQQKPAELADDFTAIAPANSS